MPKNASEGSAAKLRPTTVADLSAALLKELPDHHHNTIGALLASSSPDRPVDLAFLRHWSGNAEEVRATMIRDSAHPPADQHSFHVVSCEIARHCAYLAVEACEQLDLDQRADFLCRHFFPVILVDCGQLALSARKKAPNYSWGDAAAQIEQLLGAPGLLTQQVAQDESEFYLETQFAEGLEPFSALLRAIRLAAGQTQTEFVARYKKFGLTQTALSSWERGKYLPSRSLEKIVRAIADHTRTPQLLAEFIRARDLHEARVPRARMRDIDFGAYVTPQILAEMKRVFRHDSVQPNRSRSGAKNSMGPLAKNSLAAFARVLRVSLAACCQPFSADLPARVRGLGWARDSVALVSIILTEAIDAVVALVTSRRRGTPDQLAYADRLMLQRLADLARPHGGYFWAHADEIAAENPKALERFPTHWPAGSESPGTPCLLPGDRIRAACHLALPKLRALGERADRAPKNRRHLATLSEVLTQHTDGPVTGVLRVLRRFFYSRELAREDRHNFELVLAYLALGVWRPQRVAKGVSITRETMWTCSTDEIMIKVERPHKNPRSLNARKEYLAHLPRELRTFFLPYYRRRAQLGGAANAPFFVLFDSTVVTPEKFRRLLDKYVWTYGRDLFPLGLLPHDLRHIVATDLCIRYGTIRGLDLASGALRNSEATVRDDYLLLDNLPEHIEIDGERSQARAIRDAARAAAKYEKADRKMIRTMLRTGQFPTRLRRSSHAVHQGKARAKQLRDKEKIKAKRRKKKRP